MSDQELCRQVAKIWVDNGGDSQGLYWGFHILLSAIEDYEEEIRVSKGENYE